MNTITQQTVEFVLRRLKQQNVSVVDLTWFNQYSQISLEGDLILLFDVADPIYFEHEKIAWIKSLNKPVVFIGHPNSIIPCPVIPFLSWLRFRPQSYEQKESRDNFFVSLNRKPHDHRLLYFDQISKSPDLLTRGYTSFFQKDSKHEISSLKLDDDIVKLQNLAQTIDEKQRHSLFEIVCETCPAEDQLFFTEKTTKCIASETPLLLIGSRFSLSTLKNYYGFKDFGLDDSYDAFKTVEKRIESVITQASLFFNSPLNPVFDNAKRNAYHLFNKFDTIHDSIFYNYLRRHLGTIVV